MLCTGMPFELRIGAADVDALAVTGTCSLRVRFSIALPFSFPRPVLEIGPTPTDVLVWAMELASTVVVAVSAAATTGIRRDVGTTLTNLSTGFFMEAGYELFSSVVG